MKVGIYTIAFVLTCMISCTSKHGNSTDSKQTTDYSLASLEEVKPCLIPLDSMTSQETSYLQLINDSTLAFMNKPAFNICIVNLNKKTTSKIQLRQEGPNAINYVDAFCYLNPDSIWIFESWGKKLTLVDSAGVVKQRLQIPEKDRAGNMHEYAVYPYPTSIAPYLVQGTRHLLQGMTTQAEEGQKAGVTLFYDVEKDSVSTGNPYPNIYGDISSWDVFGYRHAPFAIMPDGNLLTCFHASDSIYVYNPTDKTSTAYFAGHNGKTNIKKAKSETYESYMESYVTQYAYAGVLRDKSEDAYYRFLRFPLNNLNIDEIKDSFTKKPTAVIILDGSLNIIGETILPGDLYFPSLSFVNSNGLHINVESEDDDFMKFRVFKLRK